MIPPASAFSDERVRQRLMRFLWTYETIVIGVMLLASFNLATSHGGSWVMAAPVVLVAAAESTRIALSGWATRVSLVGKAIAFVALAAISVCSFEALSLALEQLVNARVASVMTAGHEVEAAQRNVGRVVEARTLAGRETDKLVEEVRSSDLQVAELNRTPPPQAAASSRTCADKRGRRVSCASDYLAAAAASRASDAHVALLKSLADERARAQARLTDARARTAGIEDHGADDRLSAAQQRLADELQLSPMHRLAATLYGIPATEVTDAQFQTVKKWIVFGLAGAFATLSAAVSTVAHLEARTGKPSKLARAFRAMLAARRKTLRRIRETVRTEYRDRVRVVHVPVDRVTGLVLDPDAKS